MKQRGWRLRAKRTLDAATAAVGLVATAPVTTGVALSIWATMGRPILFRQQRPGRAGRPFHLLKFRTMSADGDQDPAHDEARLTPLGRVLRATSLDELPQLWNVLSRGA